MKIEFNNWFYTLCDDGTRMWAFSTPSINGCISEGYWYVRINFLFWDLTIEKGEL